LIGNGSKLVGLHPLENTLRLDNGRVDRETVRHILLRCYFELPNEALFYLTPCQQAWSLRIPEQIQSPGGVRPADPFNMMARDALIEVHSHNSMPAYFSGTDNHDETGFRIYAVIGRIDSHRPEIRVRIGVYGNFIPVPAGLVFDLGGTHLRDAAEGSVL
jgi:PRTRC genetic system protein A